MRKHVDAIALLVILLGFLMFSKARDARVLQGINRAAIKLQDAIERIEIRATRFQQVVSAPFHTLP